MGLWSGQDCAHAREKFSDFLGKADSKPWKNMWQYSHREIPVTTEPFVALPTWQSPLLCLGVSSSLFTSRHLPAALEQLQQYF